MNLKTDDVINFSSICKKNNLQFPSERFSDLINYLNIQNLETVSDELQIMYHLLPTNKNEKEKLKDLISQYFGYVIKQERPEFINLDQYKEKNYFDNFTDDVNSRFQNISKDILNNFGEIDFSRPVSNMYWLNQIKKSQVYENEISFFNISFETELDQIVNSQNKENFTNNLDMKLLELIQEMRNQFKDSYMPNELSQKENLEETDFLYTNNDERNKLLKETKILGMMLANKFIKHSNSLSKGKLNLRKTIRKSLQNGGSLYSTVFKPRVKKKPRLILMCDISGSMALYSLFGLTLLFGVVQRFRSVKAFVFIDGLTEVTKDLQKMKINNIKHILNNWNSYVKADGHSDYQRSFDELLHNKKVINSSMNSLLVIGDARNNYRSISEDTIHKLSKTFDSIYWMNPERKQYWNTGDSRFMDFQNIIEHYSEVRTFTQLKEFTKKINFKKVIK